MDSHDKKFNPKRRVILMQTFVAGATTIAAGALLRSRPAYASKATKASMMYQDKPHGTAACGNCNQFVPGASASAMGTCKVVDGAISPKGWCVAYTPKA